MAGGKIVKNSFSSGIIDDLFSGRTEIAQYAAGVQDMLNMVPLPGGGAIRRAPTALVSVLDETRAGAKIIPLYLGIRTDGSLEPDIAIELYNGGITVHNLFSGTSSEAQIASGSTGDYGFFTTEQLKTIRYTFNEGKLFLVDGEHDLQYIDLSVAYDTTPGTYSLATYVWQGAAWDNMASVPVSNTVYHIIAYYGLTANTSGNNYESVEIDAKYIEDPSGYDPSHDPEYLYSTIHGSGYWKGIRPAGGAPLWTSFVFPTDTLEYGTLVYYNTAYYRYIGPDTTTPNDPDPAAYPAEWADETIYWEFATPIPFRDQTIKPKDVTQYNNRLILISDQYILGTAIGNYAAIEPGTDDDDPFLYKPLNVDYAPLKWVGVKGYMMAGSSAREYLVYGSDYGVTATAARINEQSAHGSCDVQPVLAGDRMIMVERDGKTVLDYIFSDDATADASPELTLFAKSVTEAGIVKAVSQRVPYPTVWFLLGDGTLAALLYSPGNGLMAWHRHDMKGRTIEDISVCPGDTQDVLYLSVLQENGGSTYRTLEKINTYFPQVDGNGIPTAYYLDCQVTAENTSNIPYPVDPSTDPSIVILVNGRKYAGAASWAGNTITLDKAYTAVVVGRVMTSEILTLSQVPIFTTGKITSLFLQLYKAIAGTIKIENSFPKNDDAQYDILLQQDQRSVLMGNLQSVQTGKVQIQTPDDSYSPEKRVRISTSEPFPFGVLALQMNIDIHG